MSRSGIVESQKGQGGGFRLAGSPRSTTVFDIIDSIDDLRAWNRCIFGNPECSDDHPCGLHDQWRPVRDAFISLLKKMTITELVEGSNPTVNQWIAGPPRDR
jgi:Rrf2 family protein